MLCAYGAMRDGVINATIAHVFMILKTEIDVSCHCMLIIGFV